MQNFFSKEHTQRAISSYRNMLSNITPENSFAKSRNEHILLMLTSFTRKSEGWDKDTQLNINYISDSFLNELAAKDASKDSIDDVFASCFRFLFEMYINMPSELAQPFESAKSFAIHRLSEFSENAKSQIEYALREMPVSILKDILHSNDFSSLRSLPSITEHAKVLSKKWEEDFNVNLAKVENLNESLKSYEHAFNFAGLYKGFLDLSELKKSEARSGKRLILFLSVMIPLPILCETLYFILKDISFYSAWDLVKVTPAASMTLILIYFFRIALRNYTSIKAQLLQVELRKTLCQFIQSYVDYSKEHKSKEHNPLEKFEDVIFSNIMAAEDKIPSTFDGIDQLANVVNAFKGTKI
ncbi:hypothetical protein [Pantoea agglomerans]|uniref:hypothetical protein n=1 Tax=Enterobacter agglomerans TaxID=549 RepID=UPI001654A760|nr:hypothetical protein [Pantoea agglomerans]